MLSVSLSDDGWTPVLTNSCCKLKHYPPFYCSISLSLAIYLVIDGIPLQFIAFTIRLKTYSIFDYRSSLFHLVFVKLSCSYLAFESSTLILLLLHEISKFQSFWWIRDIYGCGSVEKLFTLPIHLYEKMDVAIYFLLGHTFLYGGKGLHVIFHFIGWTNSILDLKILKGNSRLHLIAIWFWIFN